ncbi:3-oxo-tetronate kinase [Dongia deserti]|uniref:3-oxo-tetronate kinase n=1 Tax=Dongia deserti TaxID=2268030 RepID=UPI000E65296A|nr:3-oxo-tetronate kinase [Dongia deserti]
MAQNGALLLGCIADDFTGATDLANTLVRNGMRTIQIIGMPDGLDVPADAEAIVAALKSRTAPVAEAVEQSVASCRWLRQAGARQIYFKYCSTFDSTDEGNIGPVTDALRAELKTDFATVCPAFPETGRTIYLGHLFVGEVLLSDSPMRNHPLTPMTDANLVRVLGRQTRASVGLVPVGTVRRGPAAIRNAFETLRRNDVAYAVVDAIEDGDLRRLGAACADLTLVTGGSGAAMELPENFRRAGLLARRAGEEELPPVGGKAAVLSGSCSPATLAQVERMRARHPALKLDPLDLAERGNAVVAEALAWATAELETSPVLVYASAPPEAVKTIQAKLGRERAGSLVEHALATLADGLVKAGVRRLVVAGGESSGAVVQAVGIRALQIGPQIDPGIPATLSLGEPKLALALKSGNFGAEDFFLKAIDRLR